MAKPMFQPFGIPLDELLAVLKAEAGNRRVEHDDTSIRVFGGNFTTSIEVIPYSGPDPSDGPVRAVVQVRSTPDRDIAEAFSGDTTMALLNEMATLGALTVDNDRFFVGSRLTIFEGEEEAWRLHGPLILCAAEMAADSLFGAVRRNVNREAYDTTPSVWTADDFEFAKTHVSRLGFCSAGDGGLTAEFPLQSGAVSAVAGDTDTALWQLSATSHPEPGGGLFGVLTMPHVIPDTTLLDAAIAELNRQEMRPMDAPPGREDGSNTRLPTARFCRTCSMRSMGWR